MDDASDRGLPPTPPSGDPGNQPQMPADEDAPVGARLGRNPGNLGDDVRDEGDVTYPTPAPETVPQI